MMDYEERREFLTEMLKQILNDDNGVFQAIAEEMDGYEGALNDSRCYPMCELDEILGEKKPSEVINMLNDSFNSNDDYFYFSIYGLESTDYPVDIYRDEIDISYMVSWLEDNGLRYADVNNGEVEGLVEMLYQENYSEDDMTDAEFKEELDSIGVEIDGLKIDDEPEEPEDIDSDLGYDPYMGMVTDEV